MSLKVGQELLHYRLVDKLGEGGMGVVWRATDTSLGRDVAIKVLPEKLAESSERLARFEREAKLLATLNHPGIAAVYGLHESDDGTRFIAMELVEGEDLSAVLARGPLDVDRALSFATQIAEALETAHEQGVIHRDLKPANVVVAADGRVKVLDFGLAKAFEPDPASGIANASMSPTLTSAGSVAGVLLGTAAYMSPEQARGTPVDKRADIWAFGCLLHEMLSGEQVFRGGTVTDILAAVLTSSPDPASLPDATPPQVRRLIERCIEKDPKRRLRDIGEARIAIVDAETGAADDASEIPVGTTAGRHRPLAWVLAAVAGVAMGAIAVLALRDAATEPQVGRFAIEYPHSQGQRYGDGLALAISPDGQVIVTSAAGGSDDSLYIRRIDDFEVRPIETARSARLPFFSPDGEWIGFVATDGLWKADLAGGPARKLGSVDSFPNGATWSTDGSVYVVASRRLWRIPENGGELEPVDPPELQSQAIGNPWAMPSGEALLLSIGERTASSLVALNLSDLSVKKLGLQGSDARYLPTGHLMYTNSNQVFVVRFDAKELEPQGTPVPVLPRVRIDGTTMQLSFSQDGTIAYLPSDERDLRRLVRVNREGFAEAIFDGQQPFPDTNDPRFSPDGKWVALSESSGPIWVVNLDSGAPTKLSESGFYPVWSPDGTRLAYGTTRSASFDLMMRRLDMSEPEELMLGGDHNLRAGDWAPDGTLVFREEIPGKGMDLLAWADTTDESTVRQLLSSDADELSPSISPDGRWIAYVSDQSGRDEVYVTRFPEPAGVIQVSVAGGSSPAWSGNGRELFYFQNREFISAEAIFNPDFSAGQRTTLFEGDFIQYRWQRQYDVHPDGEHFVMIEDPPGGHLEVILNWFDELERQFDRR